MHLSDIGLNALLVKYFEKSKKRGMLGYARYVLKVLWRKQLLHVEISHDKETLKRKRDDDLQRSDRDLFAPVEHVDLVDDESAKADMAPVANEGYNDQDGKNKNKLKYSYKIQLLYFAILSMEEELSLHSDHLMKDKL